MCSSCSRWSYGTEYSRLWFIHSSQLVEQLIVIDGNARLARVVPANLHRRPNAFQTQVEEPTVPGVSQVEGSQSPKTKKLPRFLLKLNSVLYARATAQQLFMLRMEIQKERMRKFDDKNQHKFVHTKEGAAMRAAFESKRDLGLPQKDAKYHTSKSKGLFSKKQNPAEKSLPRPELEEKTRNSHLQHPDQDPEQLHGEQDHLSTILRGLRESESRYMSNLPMDNVMEAHVKEGSKPLDSENRLDMSTRSEKYYPKRGLDSIGDEVGSVKDLTLPKEQRVGRSNRRRSTGNIYPLNFTKLGVSRSGAALMYNAQQESQNQLASLVNRAADAEEKQCMICFSREANSAFMPCGHGCICDTCAVEIFDKNGVCPICRMVALCTDLDSGTSSRDQTVCKKFAESRHCMGS